MLAEFTIQPDDGAAYRDHRRHYLAQLIVPMDDMWAAFADQAVPHALTAGDVVLGSCCIDDEGRLLRFYVRPPFRNRSTELLRVALGQSRAREMMAFTNDPASLSDALDLASDVETHTLLFTPAVEPLGEGLKRLRLADLDDQERIVAFQERELGAPREFLQFYVGERLERREMLLYEAGDEIRCSGELRRDRQQPGVAHLGLIVRGQDRGQGIGKRMLVSLVQRSRAEGLRPQCSTERSNVGARRAIEHAGFRANHRIVRLRFPRSR